MNNISRWVIVCSFLAMNLLGLSFAGEKLDKNTVEKMIKGNTLEGKWIKWKTTYKIYFAPSGNYRRIDGLNAKTYGEWSIKSNGTLIMVLGHNDKEKRRVFKSRGDGGYDVYSTRGQLIWTVDKVSPGNPYNL